MEKAKGRGQRADGKGQKVLGAGLIFDLLIIHARLESRPRSGQKWVETEENI